MKKVKILIKGAIGNSNFGDDLLTLSICKYLQSINISSETTIISEELYLNNHIQNIKIVSHNKVTGSYDIMLYAGGTQFASFTKKRIIIPNINRFVFYFKNFNILYRKITEKVLKVIPFEYKFLAIVGIGIGPFYEKNNFFFSTINFLKKSDLLSVRDKLGSKICHDNLLDYTIGSDLVFSLPNSYWEDFRNDSNSINSIAIIIRDWDFSKNEGSYIFSLINLKYKNCKINFISFCEKKDKKAIEYIMSTVYGNSIKIWNPNIMTFNSFLNDLSRYDIFITSRYHGALIASLLMKPFISIGIEPKLTMVAELFEMPCWEFPYKIDQCQSFIENIDDNYTNMTQKISSYLKIEREKNVSMMNNLNNLIIKSLDN